MSIRARKIARDLLGNRARTVLVVVAIAIGLTGLSTTLRARAIFTANLSHELAAFNPSTATILTAGADDEAVAAVADRDDVAEAQGQLVTFFRITVGEDLRPLRLEVRHDLATGTLNRLYPDHGTWPPPPGTITLERSSIEAAGLEVGDTAVITDPTGAIHELRVAAATYDLGIVSGRLVDQVIFGYTSTTTWERLGLPSGFNQIAITVAGDHLDEARINEVTTLAAEQVAEEGLPVLGIRTPPPGEHVLDNVISSLLLILGALGVLSLVLSGFLVFNTVAATLARQRPEIGVMKAIGASRRDILKLNLATVGLYSLLALIITIPVSTLAARVLTDRLGTLLNIDIAGVGAPLWVWTVELAAGLVMPAVAALGPILSGTGTTVAETLRGERRSGEFGSSRLDRALGRLAGIPESFRYAARNTFRRKLRLALTVTALSLGGAILITVLTLRNSLLETVNSIEAYWQQDVTVDLQDTVPLNALDDIVRSTGGIDDLEGWLIAPSSVLHSDGREAGEETTVFGVPSASPFIDPTLVEGRWLEPGDDAAAVINVDVAANEPEISVGNEIRLRVLGVETAWEVVGISTTQLVGPGEPRPSAPIVYVPYQAVDRALAAGGGVNRLVVSGVSGDAAAQDALADTLDADLRAGGIEVRAIETRSRIRAQVERLTQPILVLLVAMAVLFAAVGGLGLLGTMSLNVLERTSEFGIIRAIGATERAVLSIVLIEGLSVTGSSWLIGSVLAVPLGWAMGTAVGVSFINAPLSFRFAPIGVVLWLGMAIVVAFVASWVPARNASRLSVRDAIAYE